MPKIYAICVTHNAGTDFDKERIIENGIEIGDKIELENARVGGWFTDIWLVGYEEHFNSVFFDFVDENGEEYDIYSDEDFRDY